jgi:uncharacterized membrane protein
MAGVDLTVRAQARPARGIARIVLRLPRDVVACLAIGLVALGFDLYRLGAPAIWLDEAFSLHVARLPAPAMWTAVLSGEPNMNLYFLVLWGWTRLLTALGVTVTEFLARLPSAAVAAVTASLVYLLGRRFLGMTAGIVAAGFFLLNSAQLAAAQDARTYSLLLLLICASWYAWLALMASSGASRWWWLCYVATSALAVWAHLLGTLILLAQVVAFAVLLLMPGPWRATARARLRGMVVSLAAIAGLVAPHIYFAEHHGSQTGWVPIPRPRDVVHLYIIYLGNTNRVSFWLAVAAFGVGLLVVVLFRLPWGQRLLGRFSGGHLLTLLELEQGRPIGPAAGALLAWLVVPVLAAFVASQGSLRLFSLRYLIIVLPALCLLIGLGVALVRWPPAQVVMTALLFVSALIAVPHYYASAQVEDMRTPTRWLVQHYQPGDGLVCHFSGTGAGCQDWIFEYYLYDLHANASVGSVVRQSPATASTADVAAYAAQHARVFFMAGDFNSPADVAQAQTTQRWLDSHYQLIAQVTSSGNSIRLYATGTTALAGGVSPEIHLRPGGVVTGAAWRLAADRED